MAGKKLTETSQLILGGKWGGDRLTEINKIFWLTLESLWRNMKKNFQKLSKISSLVLGGRSEIVRGMCVLKDLKMPSY